MPGGRDRGTSRLCARRQRLLQAVAIGALMLPDVAWGQVTETLPEVTVTDRSAADWSRDDRLHVVRIRVFVSGKWPELCPATLW